MALSNVLDVVIVGAGPAGIGVGAVLKKMGFNSFTILERSSIGESFKNWPKQMQMISPSFTGNSFGMPDLNTITPTSSPAFSLETEHPTGLQYAEYLKEVATYHNLHIMEKIDVESLEKKDDIFILKTTTNNLIKTKYVIWAAGEFQYPNDKPFEGSTHCIHNSTVKTWEDFKDEDYLVIGAYESGIDAAYQLARYGKKVTVLDANNELENLQSDSSYSLSPFTRDRYMSQKDNIEVLCNMKVKEVQKQKDSYKVITQDGKEFISMSKPILATGFISSLSVVEEHFEIRDGVPQLTQSDESTKCEGLFLVGPQVRHEKAIFCFIYKFRQRFAVVAEELIARLGETHSSQEALEQYKKRNFYLKDLSCCEDECVVC